MFGVASDAVHTPSALFKLRGIPGEIVMDYMPAVLMEVDALSEHLSCDQDVRIHRCIEALEGVLCCRLVSVAVDVLDAVCAPEATEQPVHAFAGRIAVVGIGSRDHELVDQCLESVGPL